jgi:hypothetical protein
MRCIRTLESNSSVYYLCSLSFILTSIQIGVAVGEAENPSYTVPEGWHGTIFTCGPANSSSQPFGGVRQTNRAQEQADDNSFLPAFFRLTFFYLRQ